MSGPAVSAIAPPAQAAKPLRPWNLRRMLLTIGGSGLVWAAVAGLCLLVGSTGIGWPDSFQTGVRLPRVMTASLIGAALAAAGVTYQAILRNPLADPYLLGVSSGAALFSYIWQRPAVAALLVALGLGHSPISQQAFSFIGALAAVAVVFLVSTRRGRLEPLTLLLVGVIVNVVNAAVFLLISELVKDQTQQATFLVGAIRDSSRQQTWAVLALVAVGWVVLLSISAALNVAMLSEAEAETLGVRIHRLRWVGLVVASLITASAVAISGPIGFVGLICPHLARLIVGNDQRRLLPVATAAGAALLVSADALSRGFALTRFGTVLPVGILTSLMGGPFFLLLLYQNPGVRREARGESVA
jgi:iron complex transport system permease protein